MLTKSSLTRLQSTSRCLMLSTVLLAFPTVASAGGRACQCEALLQGLDSKAIPGSLKLGNAQHGVLAAQQVGTRPITALAFVGEGGTLAVAERGADQREGTPGRLVLLDLTGPTAKVRSTLKATDDMIASMAVTPNGKLLVTGGARWDRSLSFWNETKGDLGPALKLPQSTDWWFKTMQFSNDGRWLATPTSDPAGPVQLWAVNADARSAEIGPILPGPAWSLSAVAFHPEDRFLAAGLGSAHHHPNDGRLLLWDLSAQPAKLVSQASIIPTGEKGHYDITALVFSRDGKTLVTGDQMGSIRTWSVDHEGQLVKGAVLAAPTGSRSAIQSLVTTFNGNVISSAYDGSVNVWDLDTGKSCESWNFGSGSTVLAMAPSMRHLAVGLDNGRVYIVRLGNKALE